MTVPKYVDPHFDLTNAASELTDMARTCSTILQPLVETGQGVEDNRWRTISSWVIYAPMLLPGGSR